MGDPYLVARARDGYLDAYEMLVQQHSAMAYLVASGLTGRPRAGPLEARKTIPLSIERHAV